MRTSRRRTGTSARRVSGPILWCHSEGETRQKSFHHGDTEDTEFCCCRFFSVPSVVNLIERGAALCRPCGTRPPEWRQPQHSRAGPRLCRPAGSSGINAYARIFPGIGFLRLRRPTAGGLRSGRQDLGWQRSDDEKFTTENTEKTRFKNSVPSVASVVNLLFLWVRRSEPDKHRLRLQLNSKLIQHSGLDFVFQGDDVGSAGAAAIDDCQRVPPRDTRRTFAVALGESGVLNQPGGGQFAKAFVGGIAGQLQAA